MAARIRRSPEQIRNDRLREWFTLATTGYCGYRACAVCANVAWCEGKTYENMRCKDCFVSSPR